MGDPELNGLFSTLRQRYAGLPRETREAVRQEPCVAQLTISLGESGGEAEAWVLDLTADSPERAVRRGSADAPHLRASVSKADLLALLAGNLPIERAFLQNLRSSSDRPRSISSFYFNLNTNLQNMGRSHVFFWRIE